MLTQLKLHNIFFPLVLVLLVLATGIGIAGYSYYAVQKERARQQSFHKLSAIAELKVNEISRWRGERLADARSVMDAPFIGNLVEGFLEAPDLPQPMEELIRWMKTYKDHYDYFSISLLDLKRTIRISIPEGELFDDHLSAEIAEAMHAKAPLLGNLERSEAVKDIHLDLIIPLFISNESDLAPVGAFLLRIDPRRFLYPLIQSWPAPSRTAETLLVRSEGNEMVFLSSLRHRENTALTLRLPMNDEKALWVKEYKGRESVLEGSDYRDVPVLAVVRKIPDTDWFLVAKIDTEEVYEPARERALLIAILITCMLAGAGVTIGLILSYQRSQLYLEQYKTKAEKLELARRYEHLTRNANDIILLVNEDGTIAEANQRAITAYGYSSDELLGLNAKSLEAPDTLPAYEGHMRLAREQDGFVFETVHCRKDGSKFPVEASIRAIKQMGKHFYLGIIRDITERKQAEETLKEVHDSLERRVQERTTDLLVMNERLKQEIEMRVLAEKECRAVTVRLADTEESERRRLSRELHDRVGQNLTVLNFNLSTVSNLLPADSPPEVASRLQDSLKLVKGTVTCVRDVMADLRPPLLDDYGLAAALRWYCREFSERSGIRAVLKCEEQMPRLPLAVEIALFRIAQEALVNVMRHSRASQVVVELEAAAEMARMTIADNGVGFDPKAIGFQRGQESGWGMLGMRERAEMVGGCISVHSALGSGTRIVVEMKR